MEITIGKSRPHPSALIVTNVLLKVADVLSESSNVLVKALIGCQPDRPHQRPFSLLNTFTRP
jgi:hypothetical protein